MQLIAKSKTAQPFLDLFAQTPLNLRIYSFLLNLRLLVKSFVDVASFDYKIMGGRATHMTRWVIFGKLVTTFSKNNINIYIYIYILSLTIHIRPKIKRDATSCLKIAITLKMKLIWPYSLSLYPLFVAEFQDHTFAW